MKKYLKLYKFNSEVTVRSFAVVLF